MAEQIYDGFISYSHAADDLLAPRLQSALQRFAKPWWKRRAVRIFRDESSLSANPHLWSSITEALNTSGWFVLLLSPDAARSEWVNQEIEYWKLQKEPARILPVLTDGTFGWDGADVTGTAAPEALQGVFSEEPRWVDLRFAKDETNLDLKDPRFLGAVADIASALRGVLKDELASEEVRQHRRTVRTAWGAGLGLVVLALAAVVFGIRAGEEALRANAAQLAADAVNAIEHDPELATLLAIEAFRTSPGRELTPAIENALWRADEANRLIDVISIESHFFVLDLSPDGTHLAISDEINAVVHWYDIASGAFEWTYAEPDTVDSFGAIDVSPDGQRIAVSVYDSAGPAAGRQIEGDDDKHNRLVILRAADGAVERVVPIEGCGFPDLATWSPDGRYLAYTSGNGGCPDVGSDHWVEVLDTDTWEPRAFIPTPGAFAGSFPSFDSSGRLFILGPFQPALVASEVTFSLIKSIDGSGAGVVTPNGDHLVVVLRPDQIGNSPAVIDVETGGLVDVLTPVRSEVHIPYGISVSTSGRYALFANLSSTVDIFDLASGERVFGLPGGSSINGIIDDERGVAYTSHADGTIKVWDLTPNTAALTNLEDIDGSVFGDSFTAGPTAGSFVFLDEERSRYRVQFFDNDTGTLLGEAVDGLMSVALPDGRFGVLSSDNEWTSYDPLTTTNARLVTCDTPQIDCDETASARLPCADCDEATDVLALDLIVSLRASEIFAHTPKGQFGGGELVRLDPAGVVLGEEGAAAGLERVYAVSDRYVMGEVSPFLEIRDRATGVVIYTAIAATAEIAPDEQFAVTEIAGVGIEIVELPSGAAVSVPLDIGDVRGLAFKEDGTRVAVASQAAIAIVDVPTRSVIQQLGITGASDLFWLGDRALLVGTSDGRWGQLSLDIGALVDRTRSQLRRPFTGAECDRYRIDTCPSLEEMKGG